MVGIQTLTLSCVLWAGACPRGRQTLIHLWDLSNGVGISLRVNLSNHSVSQV